MTTEKQWYRGMALWRDEGGGVIIASDELVTLETLTTTREAFLWIDGYRAGEQAGVKAGRIAKAAEVRALFKAAQEEESE